MLGVALVFDALVCLLLDLIAMMFFLA